MRHHCIPLLLVLLAFLSLVQSSIHSSHVFDAVGLLKKVVQTKNGVLALSQSSSLNLIDDFDGKLKWRSNLSFDDHHASSVLVRDGIVYTILLHHNGYLALHGNRLGDGVLLWSKTVPLPRREMYVYSQSLVVSFGKDGMLNVITTGYEAQLSPDGTVVVHDLLGSLQVDHTTTLYEMATGHHENGNLFAFFCKNSDCSSLYEVNSKGNEIVVAELPGQSTITSTSTTFPFFDSEGNALLMMMDSSLESTRLKLRIHQFCPSSKIVRDITTEVEVDIDHSIYSILPIHYSNKKSEVSISLKTLSRSRVLRLNIEKDTAVVAVEKECKQCTLTVLCEPVTTSSFLSLKKTYAVVPSALIGDDNIVAAAFSPKVVTLASDSGKLLGWDSSQSQLLWGRDDGISLIKHAFPIKPLESSPSSNELTPTFDVKSLIKNLFSTGSVQSSSFLGLRYDFDDSELRTNPKHLRDLHLKLYQLAVTGDGNLDVHSVELYGLPDSTTVTAVRIVPGGSHDEVAAVVVVDTNEGIFAWVVNKRDLISGVVAFSSPNLVSHHMVRVSPWLKASKIGALSSVAPIVVNNEISGINMLIIGIEGNGNVLEYSFEAKAKEANSYMTRIDTSNNELLVYKITSIPCEMDTSVSSGHIACHKAFVSANVKFDEQEKFVAVASVLSNDPVHSRTIPVGDNNVLVKYLNPHLLLLCTAYEVHSSNGDLTDAKLFINIVDSVSGKLLNRISHENAVGPFNSLVLENFVFVSYWNPKAKRSELSVLSLYDGLIGKYDFTPLSSKRSAARNEYDNSVGTDDGRISLRTSFATSIPLVMHKIFTVPGKISGLSHTLSAKGITNKNVVISFTSGQLFSVDLRLLNPRRPTEEPTLAEKEEGLQRYSPILGMSPFASLVKNRTIENNNMILSTAPCNMESKSSILAIAKNGGLIVGEVAASGGFDMLSEDFNHQALVGLICLLGAGVVFLRKLHVRSSLSRLWV